MFLKKRSSRIFFSRGSSRSSSGLIDSRISTCSRFASSTPRASSIAGGPVVAVVAGVEGERRVGVARLDALHDLLDRAADALGELARGGGAAQRLGELGGRRADLHPQLLEPPRHPDRPALVAEVALDLADDRRRRVRRELDAARRLEAVDGLDQPDRADLDQVLERLAAVAEASRAVLDQRQVQVHQRVAERICARLVGGRVAQQAEQLRAAARGPDLGGRTARSRRARVEGSPGRSGRHVRAGPERPRGCMVSRDREAGVVLRTRRRVVARVSSTCQAKLS